MGFHPNPCTRSCCPSSQPKFHEVANAVGAAISSVSGEIDTIEILSGKDLPEVLERIKQKAIEEAVRNGAERSTTRIADINIYPIQVLSSGCVG